MKYQTQSMENQLGFQVLKQFGMIHKWRIGSLDSIGTNTCGITAKDDYEGLDDDNNVWKYYAGSDIGWVWADANDISVNCTSKN